MRRARNDHRISIRPSYLKCMRVIRKKYLIPCNLTFDCMPLSWTILNNLNCHHLSNDIPHDRYKKFSISKVRIYVRMCVCVHKQVSSYQLMEKMNRAKIYKNVIKRIVN